MSGSGEVTAETISDSHTITGVHSCWRVCGDFMSEQFQNDPPSIRTPDISLPAPQLPIWLTPRLLPDDETLEWVYGPSLNPWWERYVTHPLLFLVAATISGTWLVVAWQVAGSLERLPASAGVGAGVVVVGAIIILGLSSGYVTRLVVTNRRIVIMQGYEVRREWGIDALPMSLIRFRRPGTSERERAIDLDSLKTVLGTTSSQVADSKTILSLGKRLANIRAQDESRR